MNMWFAGHDKVTLTCLVTYTLSSPDHILDAQKTFVSISIINVMNWPLTAFSQVLGSIIQVSTIVSRPL